MDSDSAAAASTESDRRAPKPFLRRGEGVEKRVFASRYRKAITPVPSSRGDSGGGDAGADVRTSGRRGDQLENNSKAQPQSDPWAWEAKGQELAADTELVSVEQGADQSLDGGPITSRFLRNSVKAAWETQQAEEELELEEFRALETQIKADVVGGSRQRTEQPPQATTPNGYLHAGLANGRSYAAIHQHRPPQAPRSMTRPLGPAGSGQVRVSVNAGWSSTPTRPSSRYDDGHTGGDGEGYLSDDNGYAAAGASSWGRSQPAASPSPGKRGYSAACESGGGPGWGLHGDSSAAVGSHAGGGSDSHHSFDDMDAWNDTNSFFGSTGARRGRKGTGSATTTATGPPGTGGASSRNPGYHGPGGPSPGNAVLDDPWDAPLGGDGSHTTAAEAFADDAHAWGSDQQARQQQPVTAQRQQLQAGGRSAEGDRGPDQPFVRALFSKQQQGTARKPGAGKAGAKAAPEQTGPSAAEVERLQALDVQLATVSSERANLVRLRTELEKAANRLEQERQAWEKSRVEEQARWEAQREAEESKLRRDRRVLEKQSKALLKLPNKKERTAMEAAEAALEAERREGRAREARHKLTVERLRRQLVELQERNLELREEVRWHEAQQLERGWGPQNGAGRPPASAVGGQQQQAGKSRPCKSASVQTEPLPFLPPLEGGTAAVDPGPESTESTESQDRSGAVAGGSTGAANTAVRPGLGLAARLGGRSRAAVWESLPASGGRSAGAANGRLRTMQSARPTAAASRQAPVSASQPNPASWREERTGPRGSAGQQGQQGAGTAQRWTAEDDQQEDEEGLQDLGGTDGEEGEDPAQGGHHGAHKRQRHFLHTQRLHVGRKSEPAAFGWRAGQQHGGSSAFEEDEDEEEAEVHEDVELGAGTEGLGTSRRQLGVQGVGTAGFGGRDGTSFGRASSGLDATASLSSHSFVQRDDVEVLTDEGGSGVDGLDSDDLSALAWQQHQEFMARMGLAPDGPSMEPSFSAPPTTRSPGRLRADGQRTGPDQQRQQRQQQLSQNPMSARNHYQQQHQSWQQGVGEENDAVGNLPSTSGRQPQQQQPSRQQQSSWFGGGRSRPQQDVPQGPAAGQPNATALGPGHQRSSALDDLGAADVGDGRGGSHRVDPGMRASAPWGPMGSGAEGGVGTRGAAAATSAFFGSFSTTQNLGGAARQGAFGTTGTRGAAAESSRAASSSQRPGQVDPRDSIGDLDGVSETLAALRMDRHSGAPAAASASRGDNAGEGRGRGFFGGPAVSASGAPPAFSFDRSGQQQHRAQQPQQSVGQPDSGLPRVPEVRVQRHGCGADQRVGGGGWTAAAGTETDAATGAHSWSSQDNYGEATALGPATLHPPGARRPQHQQMPYPGAAGAQSFTANEQQPSVQPVSAEAAAFVPRAPVALQQPRSNPPLWLPQEEGSGPKYDSSVGRMAGRGGGPEGSVAAAPGPGSASVGDVLQREVRHADGKVERLYASGTRLVLFINGTRKVALPDGSSRVYFANADIKWVIPAAPDNAKSSARGSPRAPSAAPPGIGVVHYYYAEVATWHSTYGGEGGVEVFYFPSGQTEAHHPGHGKEILFPDGAIRVVTADGEEVEVSWQQLSWAIQQPQPRVDNLGDNDL